MKIPLFYGCLSLATLGSVNATVLSLTETTDFGEPEAPTLVAFGTGANTISGQVDTDNGDTRDAFTFTLSAGQTLESIFLLSYDNPATGGVGNRGFYHIDEGSASVNPATAGAAADLLTGRTFVFSEVDGVDLLDTSSQTGNTIAAGELGPGTYTFNIQNTSTISAYELQFNVVPEPSSTSLLGIGALALVIRRRRHQ